MEPGTTGQGFLRFGWGATVQRRARAARRSARRSAARVERSTARETEPAGRAARHVRYPPSVARRQDLDDRAGLPVGARRQHEALILEFHGWSNVEIEADVPEEPPVFGPGRLHLDVQEQMNGAIKNLDQVLARLVRRDPRLHLGMGLLATIGATSPFVGLFGTVWGIMNSFIGISKSQTTNLAVVAPGIAEALLATAFGLAAAIPAVIIYNHFSRVTKGYLELVSRASGAAGRLLSRDLDRTHVSSLGGAHPRAAE